MEGPVGAVGSRREGRCVGIAVVAMIGRGVPASGGGYAVKLVAISNLSTKLFSRNSNLQS